MPLPDWIIEKIREQEKEQERRRKEEQPQLPMPEPPRPPPRPRHDPEEDDRGVVIIEPGETPGIQF